jgi:hypothetical protein
MCGRGRKGNTGAEVVILLLLPVVFHFYLFPFFLFRLTLLRALCCVVLHHPSCYIGPRVTSPRVNVLRRLASTCCIATLQQRVASRQRVNTTYIASTYNVQADIYDGDLFDAVAQRAVATAATLTPHDVSSLFYACVTVFPLSFSKWFRFAWIA